MNTNIIKARKKATRKVGMIILFILTANQIYAIISNISLGNISFIFMNLVFGVVFAGLGLIRLRNIKNAKICINMIDGGVKSIDDISASCKLSYDKTVGFINKLIQKGVFEGIYVNMEKRTVSTKEQKENIQIQTAVAHKSRICQACGAPNSAEAVQNGKCEYCGAIL